MTDEQSDLDLPDDEGQQPTDGDLLGQSWDAYLSEIGIESIDEIIVSIEDVDPTELRGVSFATVFEALEYLFAIGVLQFSAIVELDEGFGVIIPERTP